MLIIRNKQFDALHAISRARFLDEVTGLLCAANDELVPGVPKEPTYKDREEVEMLARKAESFGLLSNESIGVFLQVAFFIGSDFYDVFKPAGQVVRSQLLDEISKRQWLEKWHTSLVKPTKAKRH